MLPHFTYKYKRGIKHEANIGDVLFSPYDEKFKVDDIIYHHGRTYYVLNNGDKPLYVDSGEIKKFKTTTERRKKYL